MFEGDGFTRLLALRNYGLFINILLKLKRVQTARFHLKSFKFRFSILTHSLITHIRHLIPAHLLIKSFKYIFKIFLTAAIYFVIISRWQFNNLALLNVGVGRRSDRDALIRILIMLVCTLDGDLAVWQLRFLVALA